MKKEDDTDKQTLILWRKRFFRALMRPNMANVELRRFPSSFHVRMCKL